MALHFASFMRARPGKDAAAFKDWYLKSFAPRLQATPGGPSRQLVNLTVRGPDELKLSYDSSDPLERYDVVAELWFDTAADFRKSYGVTPTGELAEWVDVQNNYRISDDVKIDRPAPAEMPGPRYKLMRELFFYDDMSDAAARRCWAHHANLALKVHRAMYRYVQHWVEERLTPGLPPVRGISELCFPNREEVTHRYYESPRGKEEVIHDTAHFIQQRLPRVYANEHVVKA